MIIKVEASNRFDLSSTSKGNQIKWFINNVYYKANNLGYEGFAELLASELLKYIELPFDYIDYQACKIQEGDKIYEGCYSYNYLKVNESFVSLASLLEKQYKSVESLSKKYKGKAFVDFLVAFIKEKTKLDIQDYLGLLTKFDYLILNEDRHLNNINLIYNSQNDSYRVGPVFDNGLSLLSDITVYSITNSISDNINKVTCKPFNKSFEKQVQYFSTEPLRIRIDDFNKSLEAHKDQYANDKYYNRAVAVLNRQLRILEGKIWIKN